MVVGIVYSPARTERSILKYLRQEAYRFAAIGATLFLDFGLGLLEGVGLDAFRR